MSMQEYPSSGYVVPLSTINQFLTDEEQQTLKKCLRAGNDNHAQTLLSSKFPKGFPEFDFYKPRDEDTVFEPMEQGEWYLVFDEDELYIKKPTDSHMVMNSFGIKPEFARWSVWG